MSIEERFNRKFQPKGYKDWYLSWYYLFGFVAFLCLAYSVFASSKFYEVYLPSFMTSNIRLATSFSISAFIALMVHLLTRHVLQKWHIENGIESIDFVFPILALLIAWNIYADYQGTPEVTESLYVAPINSKSEELHIKIEETQSRVDAIFWHYRWCPKHGTKHKDKSCKNLVVPTSIGSIKNIYSKTGYSPIKDRQDIERLNKLIDQYSDELSKNNSDFAKMESKFLAKKERATKSFQFGTLVASVIYIFISIWQYRFEYEVSKNANTVHVEAIATRSHHENGTEGTERLYAKIERMTAQLEELKNSNQDTLLQREEMLAEIGRLESEIERNKNGKDGTRNDDFNREDSEFTPESSEVKKAYEAGDTYIFETVEGEGYLINCKNCGIEKRMQRKTAKFCSKKCRMKFHKENSQLLKQ